MIPAHAFEPVVEAHFERFFLSTDKKPAIVAAGQM
jgi:hypothetical protein